MKLGRQGPRDFGISTRNRAALHHLWFSKKAKLKSLADSEQRQWSPRCA